MFTFFCNALILYSKDQPSRAILNQLIKISLTISVVVITNATFIRDFSMDLFLKTEWFSDQKL